MLNWNLVMMLVVIIMVVFGGVAAIILLKAKIKEGFIKGIVGEAANAVKAIKDDNDERQDKALEKGKKYTSWLMDKIPGYIEKCMMVGVKTYKKLEAIENGEDYEEKPTKKVNYCNYNRSHR